MLSLFFLKRIYSAKWSSCDPCVDNKFFSKITGLDPSSIKEIKKMN